MNSAQFKSAVLVLASLILSAGLLACEDDSTGPGTGATVLDAMWPNADGTRWTYRWVRAVRNPGDNTLYDTPGEVPEIPSFDDAHALLVADDAPELNTDIDALLELAFDGNGATESGAEGQDLTEVIFLPDSPSLAKRIDARENFLAHLAQRRPDLRSKLPSELVARAVGGEPVPILVGPVLLHGGIFEKTKDYIGTYGDADLQLAWKFLESDLSVGHEFSFQLVPSLADDVLLHAQVRRRLDVEVAGQTVRNSLEVLYVVDFGISEQRTVLEPEIPRYFRLFDVGTVLYVPGFGPVESAERNGIPTSLDNEFGWGVNRTTLRHGEEPPVQSENPTPTLVNIWPNSDGDFWTYRSLGVFDTREGMVYQSREEVPPQPSLDEMYAWLTSGPVLAKIPAISIFMQLEFDGTRVTQSGAEGQNLAETFWHPQETVAQRRPVNRPEQFLTHVLRARPDLIERARELWPDVTMRVEARFDDGGLDASNSRNREIPEGLLSSADAVPLLLFGYAWEKTEDHIGTYGDVDLLLAWKFLESDLSVGHEFSHQLVPALADNLWLHARVQRQTAFTVGDQTYSNCLEVLYAIDFGVQTSTNEMGAELYHFRSLLAGTIVYAPELGPIDCRERYLVGPLSNETTDEFLLVDRFVSLLELVVAPPDGPAFQR